MVNPSGATFQGATGVITHSVRDGMEAEYDRWLAEIGPACRAFPGHLDLQVIRPVAGLTTRYTVIIRFDTPDHLGRWMDSEERKRLIGRVRPILATDDDYVIRSGLDFWFIPSGATIKVPVRWKQFLITWSAVYPLVLGGSWSAISVLRWLGVPENAFLITLLVSVPVVFLMVYVVMPRYTRLVRGWLFR